MQKCNTSKNLETHEHKTRSIYPDGFVFQLGLGMYQVIHNEIAKQELQDTNTNNDIIGCCRYSDFMAWRK